MEQQRPNIHNVLISSLENYNCGGAMKIFILVLHRASISVETGIQRRKRKAGRQMIVRFPNLKVASGLGNLTRQMIAADCALLLQLLVLREMQARMII